MLTTSEAARQLGVSVDHVLGLIHSLVLPAVNVARAGAKRARYRIDPHDLQRFITARRTDQQRGSTPRKGREVFFS